LVIQSITVILRTETERIHPTGRAGPMHLFKTIPLGDTPYQNGDIRLRKAKHYLRLLCEA